jgi:hypothetical protein
MPSETMVVLARYIDVRQAELALSVLDGHGIDAYLDIPYTASMFPHYVLASGGVALLVRDTDREAAEALLQDEDDNGSDDE